MFEQASEERMMEELGRRRAPEEDNEKGKAYRVRVMTESGPQERLIHTGLQTRTQAQVTAGLESGERILLKRPPAANTQRAGMPGGGMGRFGGGPRL